MAPLFAELSKLDSVPKLKAEAETRLGGVVQRLLGDDLAKLQVSELGAVVTRLHAVLGRVDGFEQDVYAKITEATKQTATLNAHAEYRRASDDEALIDIAINTSTEEGRQLLRAAALGDFQKSLSAFRPELVRLNQGRLTHNLVKESAVSVNVIGWHAGWHFQGMEQADPPHRPADRHRRERRAHGLHDDRSHEGAEPSAQPGESVHQFPAAIPR